MFLWIKSFISKISFLLKNDSIDEIDKELQDQNNVGSCKTYQTAINQPENVYVPSDKVQVRIDQIDGASIEHVDPEVDLITYQNSLKELFLFNISDEEILKYFNCETELDEAFSDECRILINDFVELIIQGLDTIVTSKRSKEILIKRCNFAGEKRNRTLQSLGDENGLSRERIRQLVNSESRRFSKAVKNNPKIVFKKIKLYIELLFKPEIGASSKRFVIFYMGSVFNDNKPLLNFLVDLIFNDRNLVFESIKNYFDNLDKLQVDLKKLNREMNVFEKRIGRKIQWPTEIKIQKEIDYKQLSPVRNVHRDNDSVKSGEYYSHKMKRKFQYESGLEEEFLTLLEDASMVVFYTVQPFKILYKYQGVSRIYIPDVFFVLKDGRGVIAELKPRLYMTIDSNYQKYRLLKKYCNIVGCGMLVTDSRTSFEEFITFQYNQQFERELLQNIENGPLNWQICSRLMYKFNAKQRDLACVIINNNLLYNIGPFIISKRSKGSS